MLVSTEFNVFEEGDDKAIYFLAHGKGFIKQLQGAHI